MTSLISQFVNGCCVFSGDIMVIFRIYIMVNVFTQGVSVPVQFVLGPGDALSLKYLCSQASIT